MMTLWMPVAVTGLVAGPLGTPSIPEGHPPGQDGPGRRGGRDRGPRGGGSGGRPVAGVQLIRFGRTNYKGGARV